MLAFTWVRAWPIALTLPAQYAHVSVSPAVTFSEEAKERFALRALLAHVPAPQCYADLRVDPADGDVVFPTFHEAAVAHGLLSNDAFWFEVFNESATRTGSWHWNCFNAVTIILNGRLHDPLAFVRHFLPSLRPDPRRQGDLLANAKAVGRLQSLLFREGTTLEGAGLGELAVHLNADAAAHEDDQDDGEEEFQSMEDHLAALPDVQLNPDQAAFRDHVLGLLNSMGQKTINGVETFYLPPNLENQRLIALDGPGGCGKTAAIEATLKTMYATTPYKAICTATTGLASSLLPGGSTMHKAFKIPLVVPEGSPSSLNASSPEADLLRRAAVIIIDEVSTADNPDLQVIDNTLRDLTNVDSPFGAKIVVFCGDLRQCATVVEGAPPKAAIHHSIRMGPYWPLISQCCFRLTINMRVAESPYSEAWNQWLLSVGNGTIPSAAPGVPTGFEPEHATTVDLATSPLGNTILLDAVADDQSLDLLVATAFPALAAGQVDEAELQQASVLAPRHVQVDEINAHCLALLPGPTVTYVASDSMDKLAITVDEESLFYGHNPRKIPPRALQ